MANKKTVVEMFEEIKALPGLTEEQVEFLEKRIEITKKKNANRSTEPTPKQLEKMAETKALQNKVVAVMIEGVTYSPTDLVKLVDEPTIASTQKITPLLTALVTDGVLTKAIAKGRSVYSLSAVSADEGEVEE